jgi:hypothetical protein
MSFEFRPGVRDKTSTLIALAGPTGCGKTFTAILMAIGIAYPDMSEEEIIATVRQEGRSRVFFIDSEGGRGLHYAPGPGMEADFRETFPYQYGEIKAPYTPERYTEAAEAAEAAGAWVIIIDSASHEYESEGGILEIADQIEAGKLKRGKTLDDAQGSDGWKAWEIKPVKSPGNWNEPKTRHKRMVNRLVQMRAHIIFCLRAEEKMLMKMEPMLDARGQPKTRSDGSIIKQSVIVPAEDRPVIERWQPICEKRFMYEMTCSFLLLPARPGAGIPIKNLQGAFVDIFANAGPEGERLGRRHGEALAHWSVGRKKGGERPTGEPAGERLSDRPGGTPPADPPRRTARQWVDEFKAKVRACKTDAQLADLEAQCQGDLDRLNELQPALYTEAEIEIGAQRNEIEFLRSQAT